MSDSIRRTKELFLRLLERPAAERARELNTLAGEDTALRTELEALLAAHETSDDYLETPAWTPSAIGAELFEAGDRIGDYELLERLGEGGMGVVFRARQREPIEREVALKLVRPSADGSRLVRRLEAERRALARMSHAGIARVYDAGATPAGRPWFAMELVEGPRLNDWCDGRRLSTRARIELFLEVCDAVHHAHQKGVLHRDLKPSNILVHEAHGRAAAKVIDFGVAKSLEDDPPAGARLTSLGTWIGTPEYMSPEQADEREQAIDTRSDLYSLGVVLYELLTGHLPLAVGELASEGYTTVRRRILEEVPPRASERVTRDGAAIAGAEEGRALSPELLAASLRGDLDWILAKTLEKEPDERYASVSELAADLRRYLAGEAVLARPPSSRDRIAKFVARHKTEVAAAALVLVALVAGLAFSLVSRADARRARDELLRLSDQALLGRYLDEADRLAFGRPEDAPALARLEGQLEHLVANLPFFREQRDRLRARAVERPVAIEREVEWSSSDSNSIAGSNSSEGDIDLHEVDANALGFLGPASNTHADWTFDDPALEWHHARLCDLVADLEDLASDDPLRSALERTRRHREWAERSADESTLAYDDLWVDACAAIADRESSPAYDGFALEPQVGLVPLGPAPESSLWEFWHPLSGAEPTYDDDGRWVIDEDTGLVFVLIPAGRFTMGARRPRPDEAPGPGVEEGAQAGEGPPHEVELARPFFLSKYEMTQGQWRRLAFENPSEYKTGVRDARMRFDDRHPVESITKARAQSLLARAGLTLPTEAQWEYAARAGSTAAFVFGDDPRALGDFANLRDRSTMSTNVAAIMGSVCEPWFDGFPTHAPVGRFEPNAFGLFDVHGNVWEWVLEPRTSYAAPTRGEDGLRLDPLAEDNVLARGGSFMWLAVATRLAHRADAPASSHNQEVGVRPARRVEVAGRVVADAQRDHSAAGR